LDYLKLHGKKGKRYTSITKALVRKQKGITENDINLSNSFNQFISTQQDSNANFDRKFKLIFVGFIIVIVIVFLFGIFTFLVINSE